MAHARISPDGAENAEMRRIFDLQHATSRTEPPADLKTRQDRLDRLREMIVANRDRIAEAVSSDFGWRSVDETALLEHVPTLNAIRYARGRVAQWMRPEHCDVDLAFQPASATIRHEPLGVVGVIAPWNYPLFLCVPPVVGALAAGNRVMVKPSELTPAFSELLREMVSANFGAAELAVVVGGVDVAQAFASLPFDHLMFTGSTSTGRKVMQAAAANLTPVTLELGGKSPAVILPDYPIAKAAHSIAFGKFVNAGQTCVAPDYVLAPAESVGAVAEAVMAAARKLYPTVGTNADYTTMIDRRHYDRIRSAVEEAEAKGARVLRHEDEDCAAARKIGPTVVIGAPEDSLLLTEEIFGPVLPIVPYASLEEAIGYINRGERPLALYGFSNDERRTRRLLDGAISGGVTINGTLLHVAQDGLPFGGVGASGIGAYHGRDGFRRFSHARAVHKVGPVNLFERLGPPWGALASTAARILSARR